MRGLYSVFQPILHILSCFFVFRTTSFGSLATSGGQGFRPGFGGMGTNQGIGSGTGM